MGFEPGHPKIGGRQKGTPNRGKSLKLLFESLDFDPGRELVNFLKPKSKISKSEKQARIHVLVKLAPLLFTKPRPEDPDYPDELADLTDEELAKRFLEIVKGKK